MSDNLSVISIARLALSCTTLFSVIVRIDEKVNVVD